MNTVVYLYVCCLTSRSRIVRSHGDVIIARKNDGLSSVIRVFDPTDDLYSATPSVTLMRFQDYPNLVAVTRDLFNPDPKM
mgnify:CR=1 FL=1